MQGNGATTSKYKWNDSGNLYAAAITLGSQIDKGYPDPIYHPVLSSLELLGSTFAVNGQILAAAKIAHEFGHVNQASAGRARYRVQNEMASVYDAILLSNGHNTRDLRLIELAPEMGGTPVEISEDREYWAEANTMLYLSDRIGKESARRSLLASIRHTIERYRKEFWRALYSNRSIAIVSITRRGW